MSRYTYYTKELFWAYGEHLINVNNNDNKDNNGGDDDGNYDSGGDGFSS